MSSYYREQNSRSASPALVAILGWLVPGSGYFLIGQRTRGIVIGVTIITLFLSGMLLAGVRVIDVPGFDRVGQPVKLNTNGQRVESTTRDRYYSYYPWALAGKGI